MCKLVWMHLSGEGWERVMFFDAYISKSGETFVDCEINHMKKVNLSENCVKCRINLNDILTSADDS